MKKTFFGLIVLLVFGLVVSCGTTGGSPKGITAGVMVYLIDDANFNAYFADANKKGSHQPTPTAMGNIDSEIFGAADTLSVQFQNPKNYNPARLANSNGWWNITNVPPYNWTPVIDDYYVLLIPRFWPSGVENQGNVVPLWDEGQISASGSAAAKKTINANPFTFSLADFKNIRAIF
jgi:hypothetical protein